jgi:VanZ family protein
VPNIRTFFKYWLPLLAWMTVIFTASSDTKSFEHSSRILAPLLRWLFPQIPDDTVHLIVLTARKCAHLIEYAVLAMLLWRALRKPAKNDPRPWNWREVKVALLVVFLYATTDEIHQIFVFSRTPRAHDVILDTLGGAAGLFALWILGRWRRHRRNLP